LLGVLSVRFNYKKLLVAGVLCYTVGALGCFLAPNYLFLLTFFSIAGIGSMATSSMAFALVGELLVLSKRPQATGWLSGGATLGGVIAMLLISFFFSSGDWRSYILWYPLPFLLIGLACAYFGVPSPTQKQAGTTGKGAYLNSFKQIFLKKSPASCLIGNLIKTAGSMWTAYFAAFVVTRFGLPFDLAVLAMLGSLAVTVFGAIVGGYVVNRVGRKRLLIMSLIVFGAMLVPIAFLYDLWISLTIIYLGSFIGAFGLPAMSSLTLEQAPESRGTLMSINSVLTTLGAGTGLAIGGAALALFNYTGLLLTSALLQLVAAAIYGFLTKDPCITKQPDSLKPKPL
jgi:predicted MFS family arabinose efflux permease